MLRARHYQERSVPKFLKKIFSILEENKYSQYVSWSDDGSALIIKNPTEFAEKVLPLYFKHGNFSSFIRQLNMYKFKKSKNVYCDHIYTHKMFQRGRIDLLRNVQRKTADMGNLMPEESQALRVDNEIDVDRLIQENMQYKKIHKELTSQVEFIENKMRDLRSEVSKIYDQQQQTQANEQFLKNVLKSLTKVYGLENIAKAIENDAEDSSQAPSVKESTVEESCFEIYSDVNNGSLSQAPESSYDDDKLSNLSAENHFSENFSTNDTPQLSENIHRHCNKDDSLMRQPLFSLDFGFCSNINNFEGEVIEVSPKLSKCDSYRIWVDELKNKEYNIDMLFCFSNQRFIGDANIDDF
jgi:hypothetical protein